jgi:hypothetical protein
VRVLTAAALGGGGSAHADEPEWQRRHRRRRRARTRHARRLVSRLPAPRLHEHGHRQRRPLPHLTGRRHRDAAKRAARAPTPTQPGRWTARASPTPPTPTATTRLSRSPGGVRVTDNVHEDVVEDWQPLKDVVAPVTHALRSSGPRGKADALSVLALGELGQCHGRSRVRILERQEIDRGARDAGGQRRGAEPRLHDHVPMGGWQGRARVDPLLRPGNRRLRERRKRSCAWFHFLPKKTKKKRR